MSRFLLILVVIPVALVLVAALLIPLLLDEQKLLEVAATLVKEETGATLEVNGEVELSLFPRISVDLNDTSITMPGEQEASINARFLGIGLELLPLLSGRVEAGELAVDGLVMTLKKPPEQPALDTSKLSDEQLDAYYAQRRLELERAGQAAGKKAVAVNAPVFNVQHLLVTDSVVEMLSEETGERSRVEIINLEATDLNLDDRTMPLTMKIRLDAGEDSNPVEIAVAAQLRANPTSRQLTLESVALEVTGVLTTPVSLQAQGVIDLVEQAADLQLELELGDTKGSGKVRFASFETPQISANLHLNKFDPALFALAGPEAAANSSDAEADGGEDQPLPFNAIRAIDTRATLVIDRANFAGHVVKKMRLKLRAVDGILKLKSLTGKLHGGELDMKATLNAKHNVAKLTTGGVLTGMSIARAIEAVDGEPVMTGKADLKWRLGSTGSTSGELIAAMNGPIELQTSDAILKNLGIEKMLCEAVAVANRESLTEVPPEETRFETLSVKLKMKKGKLNMKPLVAALPHVKLTGEGELDILAQDFVATFTARLLPGLEQLDPACRVNERLTGIGWPVNCKGVVTGDPADWCSVDSQEIIEQMATKEVQRKVEKEAGKYLDKLLGN